MDFLNDSGDEEEGEEGGFKINTAYAERYGVAGLYIARKIFSAYNPKKLRF